ncbi:MAG: hypothetical protein JWO77_2210 [Ilumatobacteraceae bacterium]|nr:hypothetical protein [Ilumatobacteraceae bacterium]
MSTIWRCPSCTTANSGTDDACVVCHAIRTPTVVAPAAPGGVPTVTRTPAPTAPPVVPGAPNLARPVLGAPVAGGLAPEPPTGRRIPVGVFVLIVAVLVMATAAAFVVGRDAGSPSDDDTASVREDDTATDATTLTDDGGSATTEPDETTTSITESGLIRRDALGTRVLVPAGWVETIDEPGGSTSTVTYQDPSSPSRLVVEVNACVGCVDAGVAAGGEPTGEPYPEGQVPSDVTTQVKFPSGSIGYSRAAPASGYAVDGVVRVTTDGGTLAGSVRVEVTLPVSEHDTASEILNYT